ncbi:MAG: carbohydrate binding family 9 domain-containing protein [Acidobacteriota bacterium]|nr:carbohydrate binding family 9 domain-containing protein [Acidobacteriota bacterium]
MRRFRPLVACLALLALPTLPAFAQSSLRSATIRIRPAAGPITIDGDLSDPGWRGATRVDHWYEINPGNDVLPPVGNVGYVTYDRHYLYVGLRFADPDPAGIQAPLGDHDHLDSSNTDFGGVIIDAQDTGRTATEFFVSASNVQYDAVTDDQSGEDSSPDFFWESATRIGKHGWTLEMRIPFSSLRYRSADPQTWGIMLWRNYPHGFRYQFSSARVPQGNNCFICYENRLTGLTGLPQGGHVVLAPYVSTTDTATAHDGTPGAGLAPGVFAPRGGFDLKFTPDADNAIDATIKPDFSQIESDTAQISANERFALSYPEKRPFFLEGVDLLATPLQAVYTRTITDPLWGGRVTGKVAGTRYTALVTEDAGGGSVIIPGPNGSSTAPQDFRSTVFVARAKRDLGLSSIGALVVDREDSTGGGHNRVFGPDLAWRPSGHDLVTGQWLVAETQTPDRPDLSTAWMGQSLSGAAGLASWSHNTTHTDWFGQYTDITSGFRADTGFMPQVGYRDAQASAGWTVRPDGPVSRERTFLSTDYQTDRSGALLTSRLAPGINFDTRRSGSVQLQYVNERDRAGDLILSRQQLAYSAQVSPSRTFKSFGVNGTVGQDIDFLEARPARGTTVNLSATLQPTERLEVSLVQDIRLLGLRTPQPAGGHLLTEEISRLESFYFFTPRLFVRLIGQYVATRLNPRLYPSGVAARSAAFDGSALLAYKINWQSVMYFGYGDDRGLSPRDQLAALDRQFFVKLSYAFQR